MAKFSITIGQYTIKMSAKTWKRKDLKAQGYTNRTSDGRYIITLDYDNTEADTITGELDRLQEDFQLSDFHIFESTPGNYHAVCLDKVSYATLVTIMRNSTIDQNYIDVPMKWGKKLWVLRTSDKQETEVRYCGRRKSEYHIREKSRAHRDLLQRLYGITEHRNMDNLTEIKLAQYPI